MSSWDEPMILLKRNEDLVLEINQPTVNAIKKIKKKLVVIAIVGVYRSGKSYLLSRLAKLTGKTIKKGFHVSASSEAQTKGIWVLYLDHPTDVSKGLLLLDTEGLGDPQTADVQFDYRILCLSILLSSNFLYNHDGIIDLKPIETLQFVSSVTEKIIFKDSEFCFPVFTFVVRNFQSDLEVDGKEVTENQFMEHTVFSFRKGADENKNNMVFTFRNCFLKRNCFTLIMPTLASKIKKLYSLDDTDLDEQFCMEFQKLYGFVIDKTPLKLVNYVDAIDGERFALLTKKYVEQVNGLKTFNVDEASKFVAISANDSALAKCVQEYNKKMHDSLATKSSLTAVLNAHIESAKTAVEKFVNECMLEGVDDYIARLLEQLRKEYAGNVQHFIIRTMSSDYASEAGDNDSLENFRKDLISNYKSDKVVNGADGIFKLLDTNAYHKAEFNKTNTMLSKYFADCIKNHHRRQAEEEAKHKKLKEEEMKHLKEEGFLGSSFFRTLAVDALILSGGAAATVAFVPAVPVVAAAAAAFGLCSSVTVVRRLFRK